MNKLTWEIARQALENFFSEKPFILFATGTSCALDRDFGMPALEQNLKTELSTGLNKTQHKEWQNVLSALASNPNNFEGAMDCIKDDELTEKVVNNTALFVAKLDQQYAPDLLTGEKAWPAAKMISTLFERYTRSADKILSCATPNYDLLGEYSFYHSGIPYLTGFSGELCRDLNWKRASKGMVSYRLAGRNTRKIIKPHIRLFKPHGSLNTFHLNNRIVQCDAWIKEPPKHVQRAMITPGTEKYQRLHSYRSDLLAEYDKAVDTHNRFLFLGFGFNDTQLVNATFKRKLQQEQCEGVIITRDTNERIEEWVRNSPKLWVVCKQEKSDSTRIRNSQYDGWLELDDYQLWNFEEFTQVILG
ncbi:MAG: hypothetical protein ACR2PX_02795 [Endozoicomonas sp.]|uniref:hypothetical protein n=1 Tax=Endozoicomonas sp. TaxID=1892382 RepID=UPI003D9BA869